MLPAVSSEVSVTADAAQVYGDYEYEISDNKVTITKYIGSLGEAVIPDSISGKPVTTIGESAFEDCKWLKKVTIPDSVTTIDRYAFCDCEKLLSVTFGKNVKSIGEGAFRVCYDLTSITLPDSLTSIGESAFECCISLESVIIPDSVTSIGKAEKH